MCKRAVFRSPSATVVASISQVHRDVAQDSSNIPPSGTSVSQIYPTPSIPSGQVLVKVVPGQLHNSTTSIVTFVIFDDAQWTVFPGSAVQPLHLPVKWSSRIPTIRGKVGKVLDQSWSENLVFTQDIIQLSDVSSITMSRNDIIEMWTKLKHFIVFCMCVCVCV